VNTSNHRKCSKKLLGNTASVKESSVMVGSKWAPESVSVDKAVITEPTYHSKMEATASELPSQESVKCAHKSRAKKQVVVAPTSWVTDEQRCVTNISQDV